MDSWNTRSWQLGLPPQHYQRGPPLPSRVAAVASPLPFLSEVGSNSAPVVLLVCLRPSLLLVPKRGVPDLSHCSPRVLNDSSCGLHAGNVCMPIGLGGFWRNGLLQARLAVPFCSTGPPSVVRSCTSPNGRLGNLFVNVPGWFCVCSGSVLCDRLCVCARALCVCSCSSHSPPTS
jgi:hypothetical protein